jgi:23S rRNA (adenine2503-C2)-methyltransferase
LADRPLERYCNAIRQNVEDIFGQSGIDQVWDPRDQSPESFLARVRTLGVPDLAARRLTSAILGHGIHDPADWGRSFQVPRLLGDRVAPLPRLTLDASVTSPGDGFQKLRFRTPDGLAVETVLIPLHRPGAVSVCLSSQVGCPMACAF